MQTVRVIESLRAAVRDLRARGGAIALVPTMGALHAGHMALIARASEIAPRVVVSIFVNPAQFGPHEDFDAYPRREAEDAATLAAAGCALLWAPSREEVYPPGFATTISVAGLGEALDGAARPGHFDGVATVVAKLFNEVRPDVALFGEKDWQQLAVIRRMARDLDLGVAIESVPTVREADGLALSSRNVYLSAEERARAVALPEALGEAAAELAAGGEIAVALAHARARLARAGFDPIDYIELRDAATLAPIDRLSAPARLLAAARLGRTRLIDNVAIAPLART